MNFLADRVGTRTAFQGGAPMTFVYRAFGRLTAALVLAAGITLAAGIVVASTPAYAQSITVRGNSRIEADAVRAHFATAPGERLDNAKIDEAVKALYATGLFEDVRVTRAGGGLIVTVVENSVINRVNFEGNKQDQGRDARVRSSVEIARSVQPGSGAERRPAHS